MKQNKAVFTDCGMVCKFAQYTLDKGWRCMLLDKPRKLHQDENANLPIPNWCPLLKKGDIK